MGKLKREEQLIRDIYDLNFKITLMSWGDYSNKVLDNLKEELDELQTELKELRNND